MKSKRAEELINTLCWRDPHDKDHLCKAVELAEEDARERAARTFYKLQRLDCEAYCTPCTGAEYLGRNEFLKHYDNEN